MAFHPNNLPASIHLRSPPDSIDARTCRALDTIYNTNHYRNGNPFGAVSNGRPQPVSPPWVSKADGNRRPPPYTSSEWGIDWKGLERFKKDTERKVGKKLRLYSGQRRAAEAAAETLEWGYRMFFDGLGREAVLKRAGEIGEGVGRVAGVESGCEECRRGVGIGSGDGGDDGWDDGADGECGEGEEDDLGDGWNLSIRLVVEFMEEMDLGTDDE